MYGACIPLSQLVENTVPLHLSNIEDLLEIHHLPSQSGNMRHRHYELYCYGTARLPQKNTERLSTVCVTLVVYSMPEGTINKNINNIRIP